MQPSAAALPYNPSQAVTRPLPGRKLNWLDPITLQGKPIPDREWMVAGYIPRRSVTILGGDGGLGKSLLAQQLLTAAAIGQPWLGLETTPCKAIALFCEDPEDELHRRQDAINRSYGVEFGDLENMRWLPRLGEANVFMGLDGRLTPLYYQVLEAAEDFGAGLIVLDSLHDLFAGNENSRAEARRFMHALQGIANRTNGAVILLAHPSVQGLTTGSGTSGNTAWNNACRSRLYLKAGDADEPNERVLQRKKLNYGARGGDLRLKWEDGMFQLRDQPATGVFAGMEKRDDERIFLEAYKTLLERGQRLNAQPTAPNYAPRLMAKQPKYSAIGRRRLELAMNRLFEGKLLEVREDGPPSHRRTFIAEVGTGELS